MYKKVYQNASELVDKIRQGRYETKAKSESDETVGLIPRRTPSMSVDTKTDSEYDPLSTITKYLDMVKTEEAPKVGETKSSFAGDYVPDEVGKTLMADLQEILGITKEQAAGLVGNLDYESGSFKQLQEQSPLVPGSRGGYGFAQWTGDRRVAFENWAESQGLDPSSYEANLGFTIHEIQNTPEGRFFSRLSKSKTAEEAATIVSKQYLRPGIPNLKERLSRARSYASGE